MTKDVDASPSTKLQKFKDHSMIEEHNILLPEDQIVRKKLQTDIKDASRYKNEMFMYAEKEGKIKTLIEKFKNINSRQKG